MKICAVIPAYNRASRLPAVVQGLSAVVDEIIIVNDGSTDDMAEVIEALPAVILTHRVNRGQGAALRTGTSYALTRNADYIVHFDADGQLRAEDVPKLLEPLIKGEADMSFGSRFLDSTTQLPAFKRRVIMPLARFVNRVLFNIRLTDPQSGFRAFNRRAAELVIWEQDRMAHTSEILAEAHRQPLRLTEVPVTVLYHEFGQNFSGGLKILRDLFLARLNK